jgi:hypothetical protein
LGSLGAASTGLGETCFALAADLTAAFVNPALLARLPKVVVTLSGSLSSTELYRFSILNTGVLESPGNTRADSTALDYGGASVRWRGWAVGIAAGITADHSRPRLRYDYSPHGALLYSLAGDQAGFRRTFQAAVARDIGRRLALGVGFQLSDGHLERRLEESYPAAGYSILDEKIQDARAVFITAGLVWEPIDGLRFGGAVRTPQTLQSTDQSLLRYEAAGGGSPIEIRAEAEDSSDEPWMAGAGMSWAIGSRFLVAADAAYFAWSRYRVTYFDEPQTRDFRDIIRFGAGVQYELAASLFGRAALLPLRAGFIYDPQPMDARHSSYRLLTLGAGLALGGFRLDLGLLAGSERGSGRDLAVRRLALTLTYAPTGGRP